MKSAEKAALYRELAKMTAADFHFDRSVGLLLKHRPSPRRRRFLLAVQGGLAAGQSVAGAVAAAGGGQISPLESSMVEAGERSGRLSQAFDHLAHYFAAVEEARREAWRAMQYPLLLLHLAIFLPEIPAAIASAEARNPAAKVGLTIAVLWVAILVGLWIWRRLAALAQHSVPVDRALGRLPFIGRTRRHWALARFSQVFHAGLVAALRMSRAVHLAGEASQSGRLRNAAAAAARRIEAGETVGNALSLTRAFPAEFVDTIATAEEVGSLDEEMARWSRLQTELATDAIQRASTWLPKIAYAVITLYVVYRILEMVSGYYGGLMRQLDL